MIEVSAPRPSTVSGRRPLVEVAFVIPARSDIVTAAVVGDFHGSATATMMARTDGCFVARIWLQTGRRYRFKYLLNGTHWENDWAADDYEPNREGGDDSVIDLGERRTSAGTDVGSAVRLPTTPSAHAAAAFAGDGRALAECVRALRASHGGARFRARVAPTRIADTSVA